MELESRVCKKCGERFYPKVVQQVWCSQRCCKIASDRKSRGRPVADWEFTHYKDSHRVCPKCDNKFTPKINNQVYCSDICRNTSNSRKRLDLPVADQVMAVHLEKQEKKRIAATSWAYWGYRSGRSGIRVPDEPTSAEIRKHRIRDA